MKVETGLKKIEKMFNDSSDGIIKLKIGSRLDQIIGEELSLYYYDSSPYVYYSYNKIFSENIKSKAVCLNY